MWDWRRMEKVRQVNKIKNEELLNKVNEERTFIRKIQKKK